eukprot:3917015-Ditylum_brightwellii.AAC.1
MAELLLMVTPGFALGAQHPGDPVLDAICIAISGVFVFPAKKLCFGQEFLAWANLGIRSVVVGCMVGFSLGWTWFVVVPQGCDRGQGLVIGFDDLIPLLQFCLESNNIVDVVLAGRGQFLALPGVADEHGFVFCLCNVDKFAER